MKDPKQKGREHFLSDFETFDKRITYKSCRETFEYQDGESIGNGERIDYIPRYVNLL